MLVLLLISLNIFTIVLTAKSELYQIEWFHSDTVNIESILCQARYSQENLMIKILNYQYILVSAFEKRRH